MNDMVLMVWHYKRVAVYTSLSVCGRLMTKLNEWIISDGGKQSSSVDQWKIADTCAICPPDEKTWYRGQIANIEESTAEVGIILLA